MRKGGPGALRTAGRVLRGAAAHAKPKPGQQAAVAPRPSPLRPRPSSAPGPCAARWRARRTRIPPPRRRRCSPPRPRVCPRAPSACPARSLSGPPNSGAWGVIIGKQAPAGRARPPAVVAYAARPGPGPARLRPTGPVPGRQRAASHGAPWRLPRPQKRRHALLPLPGARPRQAAALRLPPAVCAVGGPPGRRPAVSVAAAGCAALRCTRPVAPARTQECHAYLPGRSAGGLAVFAIKGQTAGEESLQVLDLVKSADQGAHAQRQPPPAWRPAVSAPLPPIPLRSPHASARLQCSPSSCAFTPARAGTSRWALLAHASWRPASLQRCAPTSA